MRFLCRRPRNTSILRRPNLRTDVEHHPQASGNLATQSRQNMSSFNAKVQHDSLAHKFTLDLGNNKVAHIDYRPIGRNKIEMYHTEVPPELRGQGIGRRLARGALELLATEGGGVETNRIKLTCSYLISQLDKFADENLKKMVVINK